MLIITFKAEVMNTKMAEVLFNLFNLAFPSF